ncbi:MAG: helix-turn-helix domain-containing protein [Planctomycetia bacterium]|nr:helix-turn-helix domain-containing protein [Planctomycetia bacterium]
MMDKKGVADLLGVSVRQVDYLRANEELPYCRMGQLIRFRLEAVEEWIKNRETVGRACPSLTDGKAVGVLT